MNRGTISFLAFLLLLSSTGCTFNTAYGPCYGLASLDLEQEDLVYKYDVGNIVLASIFVQSFFVPAIVVLDNLKCPVGKKSELAPKRVGAPPTTASTASTSSTANALDTVN